ncbi:hypothetical protein FOA52_005387 [Chlamydomonas sp. UWO 241]|nr:hypothetical protein FOA52_005387 [Chlamydomonas sp. UWO 241]
MPQLVSPLEHTGIGALGGMCEVMLLQPTVGFKNALQEGRPIPSTLAALYRGLGMNIASMAPITASQFGAAHLVLTAWAGDSKPTDVQRLTAAAFGGAASALVATPFECIVIHQQKSGRPLAAELTSFVSKHGVTGLHRGLLPCMMRESPYCACYLGLFPVLREYLDKHHSDSLSGGARNVISGVAAGVTGSFVSQPFDTMKTRMQAFMYSRPEYSTLRSTATTMYATGGLALFWAGLLPRMARIVCATFILNAVRSNSVAYLEEQRRPKSSGGPSERRPRAAAAARIVCATFVLNAVRSNSVAYLEEQRRPK